ncbi:DUF6093 family protein [Streptomyces sp. 8L]|uniref:DUF6093 family protein n=1 Tax=Streptomyces sp. 8L TaxID=2877242 RepID=UPI001CD64DF5|nr:DUF6093 family protein [Streptomyces sp. 8L]MCA1220253.1 DUF6093 family protein [Streptomyces sp. 8L]
MAGLDKILAGVTTWIGANLLIDTIRVTLPGSGDPVFNPDTGQIEPPASTVVYEGPGAVIAGNDVAGFLAVPDAGEPWVKETTSRYLLLTPLTAPIFPKDATVTVPAVHDPARDGLLGRSWLVSDPTLGGTVEVVRRTALDQLRAPLSGGTV